MLFSKEDEQALADFFGEYPPTTAAQARSMLRNYENGRMDVNLTPDVYLALQNLRCLEMGNKVSPKKLDRQEGKNRRKKKTGSRRG
ncbi:MAG: hypothetical protein UX28_C0003G0123 [Candidatus Pacebacteria bacterium GW2011_GWA1_46_10]|nr:MAG: hypothetical protein UX28_C0003G0123 [Candidatus Pacebacteria bacterium GW2011_GWA1_46_10]HCR81571.1 hypothetical protein [Candidatus Paceibacterota bacterium]